LLGASRRLLVAGAALGYYDVYRSSWLISEFVRKRTEWIANRAMKEGCTPAELRQRQRVSRERVDAVVAEMARIFRLVDYTEAPPADISWLTDTTDRPVIQTALVARAAVLITENSRDFPIGETRNAVQITDTRLFLGALYAAFPGAESDIRLLLQ